MKSILQYYVGVLSGLRLTDLFYFDMNLDNIFIWAQHIHIFIKLCVSEKIVTETDNRSKLEKKITVNAVFSQHFWKLPVFTGISLKYRALSTYRP